MVAFSQMKTPLAVMTVILAGIASGASKRLNHDLVMLDPASTTANPVPVSSGSKKTNPVPASNGTPNNDKGPNIKLSDLAQIFTVPYGFLKKKCQPLVKGAKCVSGYNYLTAEENKTIGTAAGITMTTGGTIWALNKLAEARDDINPDGIGAGWACGFTLLLVLGAGLLAHHIYKANGYGASTLVPVTVCMLSGFCFSMGICTIPVIETQEFVGSSMLFGVSVCLLLCAYLFYYHQKEWKNIALADASGVVGHFLGAVSLIGGFGFFSYNWVEELGDAHMDSFGMEALPMWVGISIGFFWLMRLFITNNNIEGGFRQKVGPVAATVLIAGATAGLLIGGFELCLLDVPAGAVACFTGVAIIAVALILGKLGKLSCFKGYFKN